MPKPRDPYTQLQACNFPFNHSTFFHIHFSNPSKIKLFAMFKNANKMRNKKEIKIEKTLEGKREGTWQPRVVVVQVRSVASNDGVGASRNSTGLERERP